MLFLKSSLRCSREDNSRAQSPSKRPASSQDLNAEDRAKLLERLLSQEKVVSLLYSKAFPINLRTGGLPINQSSKLDKIATTNDDEHPMSAEKPILTLPLLSPSSKISSPNKF